jgi:hypothetical protein
MVSDFSFFSFCRPDSERFFSAEVKLIITPIRTVAVTMRMIKVGFINTGFGSFIGAAVGFPACAIDSKPKPVVRTYAAIFLLENFMVFIA